MSSSCFFAILFSHFPGPLYIDVVLAVAARAEADGRDGEAKTKRTLAKELLASYQELVAECQSPRFTREAERLASLSVFAK